MSQNMWSQAVGRVCLLAHTRQIPSDAEWVEFLAVLTSGMKKFPTSVCMLVFTDGGAPKASQRESLKETLAGYDITLIVISEALTVRFVAASVSLFNKSIRSYKSAEFSQALASLKLEKEELAALRVAFGQVQQKILPNKVQALDVALKA